jgi:hypothetical protein
MCQCGAKTSMIQTMELAKVVEGILEIPNIRNL